MGLKNGSKVIAVACVPRDDSEEKSDISNLEDSESKTEETSNFTDNPMENEEINSDFTSNNNPTEA